MTLADEIVRDIRAIRQDVWKIEPLNRTQPHRPAEQKDDLARRLDRLETKFRNGYGGTPAHFTPGTIADRKGRLVHVERRRAR